MNFKNIMLGLLGLSILVSIIQLGLRTIQEQQPQSQFGLHSLSYQFVPLQPVFKNIPRAGYYTDKNLDIPLAVAQYEQAQYVLAPTLLELNNTDLPLIIFDCTTPEIAIAKMKELKLIPITQSPTGLFLATNPQAKI